MLAIYDSRKTKRIAQVSCWLESCNAHMLEVLNYMAMSNYHYLNIKLACHKKCLIGSMKLWATADIKKSVYWWAVVCSYQNIFGKQIADKSFWTILSKQNHKVYTSVHLAYVTFLFCLTHSNYTTLCFELQNCSLICQR